MLDQLIHQSGLHEFIGTLDTEGDSGAITITDRDSDEVTAAMTRTPLPTPQFSPMDHGANRQFRTNPH